MVWDIWSSFRRMPLWVQIWVVVVLVPVNLAASCFISMPYGRVVALLAIGGMLPNLVIMGRERGLSKAMAIPHLVIWTPLVVLTGWLLASLVGAPSSYMRFLAVLLLVDLISLGFDYPDAVKWLRGDRKIA